MKKRIVILGMGGHGRLCESIVKDYKLFNWLGFVDDVHPTECLGGLDDMPKLKRKYGDFGVFVAIGVNSARGVFTQKVEKMDFPLLSIIHPTAVVTRNVEIGTNVFVGANAVVNNKSIIGKGVYINSGSIVEHDNIIGDFSHLAPGAVTGGVVELGKNVFVGMGSVINDHLKIADNVFIASGSVVTKNLGKGVTVAGAPAVVKRIRPNEKKKYQ